jgi:hypothetical protein
MSPNAYPSDPRSREIAHLDVRLSRVSKSVERVGGVVRVAGYTAIAGCAALGVLVMAVGSSRSVSGTTATSAVGSGLTLVIVGLFWGIPLVLIGGYAQMRSLDVQLAAARRHPGAPPAGSVGLASAGPSHSAPTLTAAPAEPPPAPGNAPSFAAEARLPATSGPERVRILTESQKALLAMTPPADVQPGWFDDPLGESAQRFWNGTQWTGRVRD